jgi:electron-transferring-flavoprotein dehydrogenase
LSNLQRSGTHHDHDAPSHLIVKNHKANQPKRSYDIHGAPETKFCPAKVYEFVEKDGEMELQINAQNCLHCKTCSIKMVDEYIDWNVPQGGEGPEYTSM